MDQAAAARRRHGLVDGLVKRGFVSSDRVAAALRAVPRERFVPPAVRASAFDDTPLAIGCDQTVSAPHMVGIMAEAVAPRAGDRVLEVGAGCGYHAAVFATLVGDAGHVWSVECVPELATAARRALASCGFGDRVTVVTGDGGEGVAERAPFDVVSVACAAPAVPPPLIEQLAPGGRLVAPVGDRDGQDLVRVTKDAGGTPRFERLGACRFVPLVGAHGFDAAGNA